MHIFCFIFAIISQQSWPKIFLRDEFTQVRKVCDGKLLCTLKQNDA
jgi:hypothetical protein